ncbi:flavodoxin family protein [Parachitinimonas caeni]|uniref:NAD(P)H-dependent oxidoreductase n=1 Tax=Parachitinimonas caeni TaxID=3031301 RepID=A0ABT7E352_9NEIS|nr:NAD(P)H-dependent oxidoreductase [Parachitinimonas caeni]MDK2126746.1 NAD(P)H-dependent oxidoreductase [Parachitinimonas caeni]
MKRLLIIHAGQNETGRAYALAEAARRGACGVAGLELVFKPALLAGVEDLLAADGILMITPEKFGYMAGALKDFFDRTFYPAQGQVEGLPYALIVVAGNDGRGAVTAVERIVRGYPFKPVDAPLVVIGEPTADQLAAAEALGAGMAEGVALGIF